MAQALRAPALIKALSSNPNITTTKKKRGRVGTVGELQTQRFLWGMGIILPPLAVTTIYWDGDWERRLNHLKCYV
jgi:hypothetical protein